MNLSLPPKPAATGPSLHDAAYAEAFAAGVAAERAKWVTAAGAVSAIGMHPGEAVDWNAMAAELNAEAGLSVPVVGA